MRSSLKSKQLCVLRIVLMVDLFDELLNKTTKSQRLYHLDTTDPSFFSLWVLDPPV